MKNSLLYRRIGLCVVLSAATLLAYAKTFRNGFVDLDDVTYLTQNPHLQSGLSCNAVKWAASTYYASNWHPLTWISHAADISLFQFRAGGHHAVNLALHAANAILLFVLLYMATKREWPSWFVAAAFALHPINVESVAWASERKNVLSMVFLLLAMISYTAYARQPSLPRYLPVFSCFALGLLAKPQIITLPFLLLLWDYWPLERWSAQQPAEPSSAKSGKARHWAALVLEKVPLFLLAAISSLLTVKAQSAGGAIQVSDTTVHAVAAYPLSIRLQNAALAYVDYIGDALWPSGLAALYPHPGFRTRPAYALAAAGVLLAVTAVALAARRNRAYITTGWFWFLGALVPMIGLIQVGSQARADRYAYLPFIGLFWIAGWAMDEVTKRWPAARIGIVTVASGILLGWAAVTFRQTGYWENPETLWNRALQTTSGNFVAHDSLAGYLNQSGRIAEGCRQFEASLRIFPGDIIAQEGLGVCYQARGETEKAILQYENVLLLSVDRVLRANAYANLGSIYRQRGRYSEARQNYESALALNPDLPLALVGTGLLAQKGWDFSRAAQQYARAMSIEPTGVGYLLLANALEQGGRADEAKKARAKAERISADIRADEKTAAGLLAD
jgi:tetratricopeptide (TPR) repeat protein